MKENKKFLYNYLNAYAPVGQEEEGQSIWRDYIEKFTDVIHTDAYGTSYGIKRSKTENSTKVVIEAHCDEIAWIITNIDLYPEHELHVFNKWGNEVYNNISNNQDEWDGTHYGNPLPSDVYYYILKLNNADDIQYSGTITLLR